MSLEDAIRLIEAGNLPAGRETLEQLLEQNEINEQAWFWLSKAVDDIDTHIICLENVLAINPNNTEAHNRLKELDALPESRKVEITRTQNVNQPAGEDERDIGKRLDELKYKCRVLDAFSAMVSSEVRTPVTAIRGYVEILLMGVGGDLSEKQKKYLTEIQNHAEEVASVFEQFIDVHRVLLGDLLLNFQEVDIKELVRPIKPDNLSLNIPKESPMIWGDPHRLAQAFRGLFSGAVLGWGDTKAYLRVIYNDEWMNFKIVSAGDVNYLEREDYPDPMLFYSQMVIKKHGGEYRLVRSEEEVKVEFSLPIVRDQVPV